MSLLPSSMLRVGLKVHGPESAWTWECTLSLGAFFRELSLGVGEHGGAWACTPTK